MKAVKSDLMMLQV